MNNKIIVWTSNNGVWSIHTNDNGMRTWYSVESNMNGFIDFPLMYANGQVVYDFPEKLPVYVKQNVKRILTAEKQQSDEIEVKSLLVWLHEHCKGFMIRSDFYGNPPSDTQAHKDLLKYLRGIVAEEKSKTA